MKNSEIPPIVNFAAVDYWYHNRTHSEIQLAIRLSKRTRVLFVNSIGMRAPLPGRTSNPGFRIVRKIKSLFKGLRRPVKDLDNFYVFTPIIIPAYSTPLLRKLNFVLIAFQMIIVCKLLKIKNPIVFETIPTANEIAPKLKPIIEVINRVDKMSAFGETDSKYIQYLEAEQIKRAQRTYYTSQLLMEDEKDLHSDKARFLDHGIDLEMFSLPEDEATRPEPIKQIDNKIIGFFGGIDDYVIDIDLLLEVADTFKDQTLFLIGEATCDISDLTKRKNVIHIGMQPPEIVAQLGAYFDVAILPRRNDEWTKYTNPIKIKEYLALGLNIVTMDIPEVRKYANNISIAKSPEEFVEKIRIALKSKSTQTEKLQRRNLVAHDTWNIRCEEVIDDLRELLSCAV